MSKFQLLEGDRSERDLGGQGLQPCKSKSKSSLLLYEETITETAQHRNMLEAVLQRHKIERGFLGICMERGGSKRAGSAPSSGQSAVFFSLLRTRILR